jgi:hypothetical protein
MRAVRWTSGTSFSETAAVARAQAEARSWVQDAAGASTCAFLHQDQDPHYAAQNADTQDSTAHSYYSHYSTRSYVSRPPPQGYPCSKGSSKGSAGTHGAVVVV